MNITESHSLDAVRRFCFPGGEDAARRVKAIRINERGEMQTAPKARPIAFTAEQVIDACASRFRWEARFRGGLGFFNVVDAYENGCGSLAIRAAILPVKKMTGPDFDFGELLRYLASFAICPPMLLNHGGLVWTPLRPGVVQVREGQAAIDVHFDDRGCPVEYEGNRPRMEGSRTVLTRWSGRADGFREWDGVRVAGRTEAFWQFPEGPFRYFQSEITSAMTLK